MQQDLLTVQTREGKTADTRILQFEGPLTLSNLFMFQAELRKVDSPVTILDLTGVPYMDSAGLGVIMNVFVSAQGAGRKFILTGVNDRVRSLLEMTKVAKKRLAA